MRGLTLLYTTTHNFIHFVFIQRLENETQTKQKSFEYISEKPISSLVCIEFLIRPRFRI